MVVKGNMYKTFFGMNEALAYFSKTNGEISRDEGSLTIFIAQTGE